jgi:5'-3' exonuclease
MGIPSYYKKLLDVLPGLVTASQKDVDWLFMDFNCLIYHCLPHALPYDKTNQSWEAQFLECVVTYCKKVVKQVAPKKGVYIAIDGVVPMAKMKQQRLRRFKSAWLAKQESTTEKWDTNAITPGTAFMGQLKKRLEQMMAESPKQITLSASDEPGEGEHKIIAAWRTGQYVGNYAIYGLDADLIVLSLLGRETCSLSNQMWLFREEMVAGVMARDAQNEEQFEWFSLCLLREWLIQQGTDNANTGKNGREWLLTYCFAMSILGNDFLPGSLGLKIRDDGHSELLRVLSMLSHPLIDSTTLAICMEGVIELFHKLSITESERICRYITKKQMFARNLIRNATEVIKVGDMNWPLLHVEEACLLENSSRQLTANWKEQYMTRFVGSNKDAICQAYLEGMNWIWLYYTGKPVCFNWYYPFALPPLWGDLALRITQCNALCNPMNIKLYATDIHPVEQLAVVLPLESWHLLPPCKERDFPLYAPHFFPTAFSFETVGKRSFWECESLIPLPTIIELKRIIRHASVK